MRRRALVLLVLAAASGCGVSDGATLQPRAERTPDLSDVDLGLGFAGVVVPGDVVPGAANEGTATVSIVVATAGGGRLTWAPGRDGGTAIRTPAYAPDGPVPAAALVVWPDPSVPDPLDPGTGDFEVSVDFRADPATAGRPGDDGDNLVQRGRFGEPAQLKIQVDHGLPSCRLAGTLGEALVKADGPVEPDRWYRLTCLRSGPSVRLRLEDLDAAGAPREWVVDSDPGAITFAHIPLSIGAKVTAGGRIATDSVDQFHGTIDRVLVDVR
ncbi:hypothetical protein [Nocardioides humi]|uniref:Laminin G domain-containing protein n=1 Tax=Nocardioides humi TaxID=449461 RepID=A0ABN2A3A7_9ACTN|nr:hypothetical protein [Nocardioides humi]